MNGKTIVIEYNGSRFPRVVALRGGSKTNFHQDRKTLELDEYDALLLLKSNTRVSPEKFEFTIVSVIGGEDNVFEKDIENDDENTGNYDNTNTETDFENEEEDVEDSVESGSEDKPKAKGKKFKITKNKNRGR